MLFLGVKKNKEFQREDLKFQIKLKVVISAETFRP